MREVKKDQAPLGFPGEPVASGFIEENTFRECYTCGIHRHPSDFIRTGGWNGCKVRSRKCKECYNAARKNYYHEKLKYGAGMEKVVRYNRHRHLKDKFGLTIEDFDAMLTAQNGVCAICSKEETAPSVGVTLLQLSVDHCHKTGRVRGLLCRRCNNAMGQFEDSIELFWCAINYLIAHGAAEPAV